MDSPSSFENFAMRDCSKELLSDESPSTGCGTGAEGGLTRVAAAGGAGTTAVVVAATAGAGFTRWMGVTGGAGEGEDEETDKGPFFGGVTVGDETVLTGFTDPGALNVFCQKVPAVPPPPWYCSDACVGESSLSSERSPERDENFSNMLDTVAFALLLTVEPFVGFPPSSVVAGKSLIFFFLRGKKNCDMFCFVLILSSFLNAFIRQMFDQVSG